MGDSQPFNGYWNEGKCERDPSISEYLEGQLADLHDSFGVQNNPNGCSHDRLPMCDPMYEDTTSQVLQVSSFRPKLNALYDHSLDTSQVIKTISAGAGSSRRRRKAG